MPIYFTVTVCSWEISRWTDTKKAYLYHIWNISYFINNLKNSSLTMNLVGPLFTITVCWITSTHALHTWPLLLMMNHAGKLSIIRSFWRQGTRFLRYVYPNLRQIQDVLVDFRQQLYTLKLAIDIYPCMNNIIYTWNQLNRLSCHWQVYAYWSTLGLCIVDSSSLAYSYIETNNCLINTNKVAQCNYWWWTLARPKIPILCYKSND